MKKAALIILAAFFVAACSSTQETPIVKPLKTTARAKPTPKPENPESFRAVEKPSTYSQ
jgi:flagellar basal body L-ring protein FlgH